MRGEGLAGPRLLPRNRSSQRDSLHQSPQHAQARHDQAQNPQTEKSRRLVGALCRCESSSAARPLLPCRRCAHLIAQPDFHVEAVVTQPDRPRGRGQEIATPPVKGAALAAGIPVFQPEKIKSEAALDFFRGLAPDVVVIIAYGQIISQRLIDIPRLGWINLHASLLPKYRGAAPINWAIVNGETRTGLTTMQIDAGLDTGPMLLKHETEIGPRRNGARADRAARRGGRAADRRNAARPRSRRDSRDPAGSSARDVRAAAEERRRAHRLVARARRKSTTEFAACSRGPARSHRFAARAARSGESRSSRLRRAACPGIILPTQEDGLLVICGGASVAAG